MIPTRTVNAFLQRQRDDCRPLKDLPEDELDRMKNALPCAPPIWNKLKKHQKVCVLLGAWKQRFAIFADTGCGKSLISIALTRYFHKREMVKRVLVLVPARVNKHEWAREIEKHSPDTSYCVLHGSSKDKWGQLQGSKALMVIETYPGFVRMVCDLAPHKRKNKNKLVPNRKLIEEIKDEFQGLILDESTAVKRKSSLPSRICRHLGKSMQFLFPLTGTPFGRDPTDLWSQVQLVDNGYTLGETLGLYRAAFFTERQNFWGGMEYKFIKKKQAQLNRFLAHSSIRYEADETDLPQVVAIRKYCSLPQDAHTYYDKAKATIRASRGNVREIRNAFLRMRQISSGFVGYFDDDEGERAEFVFDYNPKLELLLTLIESIREDRKVVVCHDFIWSGDRIAKELTDLEIGWVRVSGSTKDPAQALHKFDHDPKVRVMLLSNSMVMGLNLQVAKYLLYFESPVPVITRIQSTRRVERQGSKHEKVFIYDLLVRDTVDERILAFHKEGGDLLRAIIDGRVRV